MKSDSGSTSHDHNHHNEKPIGEQPNKKKKTGKVVKLQVPEGCVPGSDSLTFSYLGKELEIPVPNGSKAGDILEIQLGGDDSTTEGTDGHDDEEGGRPPAEDAEGDGHAAAVPKPPHGDKSPNVTAVPLNGPNGGTSLDIYATVPTSKRGGDTDGDDGDNGGTENGNDGTHAMAWPAGLRLAEYLSSSPPSPLRDVVRGAGTVVELGSGSGLCGLAFAAAALSADASPRSSLLSSSKRKRGDDGGGAEEGRGRALEILLTDVPSALELLEYNVAKNRDRLFPSSSSSLRTENVVIRAMPLVWGDAECTNRALSSLGGKRGDGGVDLILGSDLLYEASAETLRALGSTVRAIDTGKNATVLLSVRWRKPEEERRFFREMEGEGYEFRLLSSAAKEEGGLCGCSTLGWKEFGNPACNSSNDFFTNTYVQVDRVQKALKDVTEDDMDDMGDDEHAAFEAMFIQIYVGKWKSK